MAAEPYDPQTEPRLRAVEAAIAILPTLATKLDVAELKTRFDTILPTLATKADLADLRGEMHRLMTEQTWKFISWVTVINGAMVAAAFLIAKYVP